MDRDALPCQRIRCHARDAYIAVPSPYHAIPCPSEAMKSKFGMHLTFSRIGGGLSGRTYLDNGQRSGHYGHHRDVAQ